MPERAHALIASLVPVAVVVAVFGRIVGHPFLAYDDTKYLLENPQVVAPGLTIEQMLTPTVGYIVPVTTAVQALLYRIGDGDPWIFHLAGLALHATAALGVLALARRCGSGAWMGALAATLFSVHPLVVEPVCWATGLKDLLAANFTILATRLFIDVAQPPTGDRHALPSWPVAALAVLAFFSKPTSVLVGLAWWAHLASLRCATRPVRRRAVLLGSVVTALGLAVGFASRVAHDTVLGGEDQRGFDLDTALWALGRQVAHGVIPVDLAPAYPIPDEGVAVAPWLWIGVATIVALAAALIGSRRRPEIVLLLTLAISSYLPVSGVLPFARIVADSYAYVPLASLSAAVAVALAHAKSRIRLAGVVPGLCVAAALGLATLGLGALTSRQVSRWGQGEVLWREALASRPGWERGRILLADELVFAGDPAAAAEEFQRVFRSHYHRNELARFGIALGMSGRLDDAECVLIEGSLYDQDTNRALHGYAVTLVQHPDRAPAYPEMAAILLPEFARRRDAGLVRFPPELEAGLATQLRRIAGVSIPEPVWSPGSCAVFGGGTTARSTTTPSEPDRGGP